MEEASRQNTFLKSFRAAYSEMENLKNRVLDLTITPAVKLGSSWEADMNFKLLKDVNSLLEAAKSEASWRAARAQRCLVSMKIPFHPSP